MPFSENFWLIWLVYQWRLKSFKDDDKFDLRPTYELFIMLINIKLPKNWKNIKGGKSFATYSVTVISEPTSETTVSLVRKLL